MKWFNNLFKKKEEEDVVSSDEIKPVCDFYAVFDGKDIYFSVSCDKGQEKHLSLLLMMLNSGSMYEYIFTSVVDCLDKESSDSVIEHAKQYINNSIQKNNCEDLFISPSDSFKDDDKEVM